MHDRYVQHERRMYTAITSTAAEYIIFLRQKNNNTATAGQRDISILQFQSQKGDNHKKKTSPAGRRGISSLASTSSPVIWSKKGVCVSTPTHTTTHTPTPLPLPTHIWPLWEGSWGRGKETDGAERCGVVWSCVEFGYGRCDDGAGRLVRDLRSFCFYGVAVSGWWERCPVLSISGLMGGG
jgi:hypothetical protein